MYDEIDIEDQEPLQLPHIGHIKFTDDDSLSPATKRARLDINYSIAPASVFNNGNGSPQAILNKSQLQQIAQQQSLQQNRRKMTLFNRIA